MGVYKKVFLLVALAFLLDGILAFALTNETRTVMLNIPARGSASTSYREKTTSTIQTYRSTKINTDLTDPCTDCTLLVKFETIYGDYCQERVKMGGTIHPPITGFDTPGTYRLVLTRDDFTLVTTYTFGEWDY